MELMAGEHSYNTRGRRDYNINARKQTQPEPTGGSRLRYILKEVVRRVTGSSIPFQEKHIQQYTYVKKRPKPY